MNIHFRLILLQTKNKIVFKLVSSKIKKNYQTIIEHVFFTSEYACIQPHARKHSTLYLLHCLADFTFGKHDNTLLKCSTNDCMHIS